MIKLNNCKVCGSSKFVVGTYARVIIPYEKYTGEITKELLQDEDVIVANHPSIRTALFCDECGEVSQESVNIDELTTRELCTELSNRVEALEEFREVRESEELNSRVLNRKWIEDNQRDDD